MPHYHYDCEEWCEQCLPVPADSEEVGYDGGEQDTPAHCAGCGRPLDYRLTAEGVEYVVATLRDALETGIDDHIIPAKGTAEEELSDYYHGSPHYEITRDWARELSGYGGLSDEDEATVARYLEECDKLDFALKA